MAQYAAAWPRPRGVGLETERRTFVTCCSFSSMPSSNRSSKASRERPGRPHTTVSAPRVRPPPPGRSTCQHRCRAHSTCTRRVSARAGSMWAPQRRSTAPVVDGQARHCQRGRGADAVQGLIAGHNVLGRAAHLAPATQPLPSHRPSRIPPPPKGLDAAAWRQGRRGQGAHLAVDDNDGDIRRQLVRAPKRVGEEDEQPRNCHIVAAQDTWRHTHLRGQAAGAFAQHTGHAPSIQPSSTSRLHCVRSTLKAVVRLLRLALSACAPSAMGNCVFTSFSVERAGLWSGTGARAVAAQRGPT
jgi:hypothetical protein